MELVEITRKIQELPKADKWYAGTAIPLWLSFTIYMLIGIPIL